MFLDSRLASLRERPGTEERGPEGGRAEEIERRKENTVKALSMWARTLHDPSPGAGGGHLPTATPEGYRGRPLCARPFEIISASNSAPPDDPDFRHKLGDALCVRGDWSPADVQ